MIELHKIGFLVDQLRQTVVLFEELYGSKETVATLNRTSVQSFSLIRSALLYEIIMRISSLLDPAETMGSDNLTFDRLLVRMDESVQSELRNFFLCNKDESTKDELTSKISLLESFKCEIIELHALYKQTNLKKYRNKLGAHLDVDFVLGKKQLDVKIDFQSLSEILNKMIAIIAKAGSLYNGQDKDQFLHRKTKMPDTAGGKLLIQKLKSV